MPGYANNLTAARPRDKLMNVDLEKFRRSLNDSNPPSGLALPLTGLWWDAKENWAKAHEAAQRDEGPQGSWVHVYLHRKEGDASNAAYWYRRAGKPVSRRSLEEEWIEIAQALLAESGP
jgi:hypothetical protein